jgi:hypothetical protein
LNGQPPKYRTLLSIERSETKPSLAVTGGETDPEWKAEIAAFLRGGKLRGLVNR